MSFRRLTSAAVAAFCVLAAGLALASAPALAVLAHPFLASFGSFVNTQGVAVDQSTGDVYVYDASTQAIYKFNAAGEPAEFSALKTDVIEGVGGGGEDEMELAVDSSSGPAKGDIYLANSAAVVIYDANGNRLGELNGEVETAVPGAPWGEPCGVAVDSAGHVYVGIYPSHVSEYTPITNPVTNSDYSASLADVNTVCNIAADSEGSVYVDTYASGPVTKYEALQFGAPEASGTPIDSAGSTLAVDPANNELYVDEGKSIAQYDALGALRGSFGAAGPGALSSSHGIAVSDFNGDTYVSDNSNARIDIFGPTEELPDVTTGSAANVQPTSVTLGGSVNPEGKAVSSCEFEYGSETSYGQSAPCAPVPGSGNGPVAVSADLSGLQPGTLYHYRLAASDADGTNDGKDATFATPSRPVIDTTTAVSVGSTTAEVSAQINPNYAETTYHFEYGTSTDYGNDAPVPDAHLNGSVATDETATWTLSGLQPGTPYHLRVVASNRIATTDGADVTFTTAPSTGLESSATNCPNAALRVGLSADLPDCRAYEMVSAQSKNGGNVSYNSANMVAAAAGGAAMYTTRDGFGDTRGSAAAGFVYYRAVRGASGWTSYGVTPYSQPKVSHVTAGDLYIHYSDDLTAGVLEDVTPMAGVPAPQGLAAPYLATFATNSFTSLAPPTAPINSLRALLEGNFRSGSSDLSHVLFDTSANLTPETSGEDYKLYEWDEGLVRLVSILPNGSVAPSGGTPNGEFGYARANPGLQMMSSDGSRAFFVAQSNGQLYMRKNASTTTLLSEPEASTPDPTPGPVVFRGATPTGTKVLFSSLDQLTDAAPPTDSVGQQGNSEDLYLYTDGANPSSEANLTFISSEVGAVLGMGEDGSSVYFVKGNTENGGEIYLWREGALHAVGKTSERGNWDENSPLARVTPDGRYLLFSSQQSPPSIHNAGTGLQLYLYDATAGSVRCISCNPTGAITRASASILSGGRGITIDSDYLPRPLSDNDRYVFFNTAEALVPQDINGAEDAYEYNIQTGKLALLSSGTNPDGSYFLDANADGSEVYFATDQPLVGSDIDTLVDIYVAKIDGGFPEPPTPLAPCSGDACQGAPPVMPAEPFPGSSTFSGPGNPHPTVAPSKQASPKKKTAKKKPSKKRAAKRKAHKQKSHKQAKRSSRRAPRPKRQRDTRHTTRKRG
jgi:hypothetical protein